MGRQSNKYDILLPRLAREDLDDNIFRIREKRRRDGVEADDLLKDLQVGQAYLVNSDSKAKLHRAVNTLAGYFKREFRFDFNQYPLQLDTFGRREAWLWADEQWDQVRAIGAALFYEDDYEAAPDSGRVSEVVWTLGFVWLHPYERDEGLLSASWKGWQERYPGFVIEQPWPSAMRRFLERYPHTYYDGTSTAELLAEDRQR